MARPYSRTKTTSGACTVTVSKDIEPDLLEHLRAQVQEALKQTGEYDFGEISVLLGLQDLTRNRRETIIHHLVEAGKLTQRKPGQIWFYRMA
jgi:hypothetical protein